MPRDGAERSPRSRHQTEQQRHACAWPAWGETGESQPGPAQPSPPVGSVGISANRNAAVTPLLTQPVPAQGAIAEMQHQPPSPQQQPGHAVPCPAIPSAAVNPPGRSLVCCWPQPVVVALLGGCMRIWPGQHGDLCALRCQEDDCRLCFLDVCWLLPPLPTSNTLRWKPTPAKTGQQPPGLSHGQEMRAASGIVYIACYQSRQPHQPHPPPCAIFSSPLAAAPRRVSLLIRRAETGTASWSRDPSTMHSHPSPNRQSQVVFHGTP